MTLAVVALLFALLSAAMFTRNFSLYRPPSVPPDRATLPTSILVPARNEERNIAGILRSVLDNTGVMFEVVVADDNSDDNTGKIVRDFAASDARVRLIQLPKLPTDWNGKQHACQRLAIAARHPLLFFADADVRLAPDALARAAAFLDCSGAALASGVPRQETGTWLEMLLIPLIHFVLLGYLPFDRMRSSTNPAYSAGCGQLFIARADAYWQCGGHASFKSSMHDGLHLPAAFRRKGYKTDLFDATTIATVRMYSSAREVWDGLQKNATEGMASPARLPVFTALFLGGHVLPLVIAAYALAMRNHVAFVVGMIAVFLSYWPRVQGLRRFRQSTLSALFHPVGVLVLLAIQWTALGKQLLGRPATWKGRAYSSGTRPVSRSEMGAGTVSSIEDVTAVTGKQSARSL